MKFAVLAALMVGTLAEPAFASDWVLVMRTAKNDRIYVNRQSIHTMSNGHKTAWSWFYNGEHGENYMRMRFLFEFNCEIPGFRYLNTDFFDGSRLLRSDSASGDWQYAPPASSSPIINFVCYGKR